MTPKQDPIFMWLKRNLDTVEVFGGPDRPVKYIGGVAHLPHETYYINGTYMGRQIRYSQGGNFFQVGDDNFDRWSNSVAMNLGIVPTKNIGKQISIAIIRDRNNDT